MGSCPDAGFERKEALSKAIGGRSQSGGHGSLCWNIEPSPVFIPQVTSTHNRTFPNRTLSTSQLWPRTVVKEKGPQGYISIII